MFRNSTGEKNICPKSELDDLQKRNAVEYTKKPITVKAWQTDEELYINTLEGVMKADKGDYIIQGVKGEYYPCKPDVFHETYVSPATEDMIPDYKKLQISQNYELRIYEDPSLKFTLVTQFNEYNLNSVQVDILVGMLKEIKDQGGILYE